MKKSIILSIIACCAAFTSCNMDEMPSTSIPTDESILTVKDCQAFSNMLHAEWIANANHLIKGGQNILIRN